MSINAGKVNIPMIKSNLHKYHNIISLALKTQKEIFVLSAIVVIISTIIDYLFILSSYPFLHYLNSASRLEEFTIIYETFLHYSNFEIAERDFWFILWLILAILSVVTKLLYVWLKSYCSNMFGFHTATELMNYYAAQTYESARKFNESSVTSAIAAKINLLVKGTVVPLFNILQAIVSLVILIGLLISIRGYYIILVVFAILIFYFALTFYFKDKLKNRKK